MAIAFLRGPAAVIGVTSIENYQGKLRQFSIKNQLEIVTDKRTLIAYVNHGRYLADCPNCNNGIPVHPEWQYAGCLECCHEFVSVSWPTERMDIETALTVRPLKNQNWLPTETLADLRAENVQKGLRVVSIDDIIGGVIEPDLEVVP